MTFIMHSDPFDDDFEDGSESPEDEKRKKRNAVLNSRYLWPGAVVPYEISSVFNGMYTPTYIYIPKTLDMTSIDHSCQIQLDLALPCVIYISK